MTDAKNLRLKDLDCLDNMLLQCFMSGMNLEKGINLQKYPRACIEYLSLILDAGASPDAKNRFNHPLSIVLDKLSAFPDVCVEAAELFIRHDMDLTDLRPMYTAIQDKLSGVVAALLGAGMSPNLHSDRPFNARGVLNFAVSILSAYRRTPNSPVNEAIHKEAEEIVRILLEHGADPNYTDHVHKVCPAAFLPYDTAPAGFLLKLGFECRKNGYMLVERPWHFASTQTCHACGHRLTGDNKLGLEDREWTCPKCGKHHDRDENAAINILRGPDNIMLRSESEAVPLAV